MPVRIEWPTSPAIIRRAMEIDAAAKAGGKANTRVKGDIRKIAQEDHIEKLLGRGLLEGVDRHGVPLARMAESTFRNRKRGFGPVLVPRGLASRFITLYSAEWRPIGDGIRTTTLIQGWRNAPIWFVYHLTGAKKAGTRWVLPKRDVAGITPAGWYRIVARHHQYAAECMRRGGA